MTLSEKEIVERRPVWDALSTLFLDTDTSLLHEYRVSLLLDSPYSLEEIEEILIHEVYPVCRWNLIQIAGEWAGFDLDWLEKRICRRKETVPRYLKKFNLGRLTIRFSMEWRKTKKALEDARRKNKSRDDMV